MEVDLPAWSDLCFGDTGFRFVRVELLSERQVTIKAIVAKSYELNKKPVYTYTGGGRCPCFENLLRRETDDRFVFRRSVCVRRDQTGSACVGVLAFIKEYVG